MFVSNTAKVEDSKLIEFLQLYGYNVTVVEEANYKLTPYDTPAAYADFDAIFISESVGSSSVKNFKTAGFPIPCVTTEVCCKD